MEYKKALDYIRSKEKFGMRLGLAKVRKLLKDLGSPEKGLISVHVAGTNGKGSTAAFISSILMQQGYRTGLFTSPHLVDFRERIRVNDEKISRKDFARLALAVKKKDSGQTYFEVITAIAFLHFKEKKADFAVIETGLGGRLDATNAVSPIVSVITSISMDHMEHLGSTIERIAFEKAGIIKHDVPTIASCSAKALGVIRKVCRERGSSLTVVRARKYDTSLSGSFQNINASLAVAAADVLRHEGVKISRRAESAGLKRAYWPGRMQRIRNIILDCAHNAAAMKALASELKKMGKVNMVVGILKDKEYEKMIKAIRPCAKKLIFTMPKSDRAADPRELLKSAKEAIAIKDVGRAVDYGMKVTEKNDVLVVTGSCYTVGEAMKHLGFRP